MSETTQPPSTDSFVAGYVTTAPSVPKPVSLRPRRWPLLLVLAGFVAGALSASLLAVAIGSTTVPSAPGIATARPGSQSTGTGSAQATNRADSPPPATAQIGETVTNGGIAVTVTSASEVPSILVNETSTTRGSGYEPYTPREPGDGAKYFAVSTRLFNDTTASIDLTCALPVADFLIDDKGRRYDSIDDLYRMQVNPDCNDNLQPGFETNMTYLYRVPTAATITTWSFADSSKTSYGLSPTVVEVD
ncbi:hypothetical protein [Pseudonocardia alni]|uniref:DUF4352 domain-containing protein n=1 Tax=Pseudonocardia alni TaxID=33907 RepID=A0AA44ZMD0_PSEA5|nr:hypothetical protein [Pseudonocardia alni]PKB28747.1 hypothetical protein ATL51_0369 [Pseudonocardia alni]